MKSTCVETTTCPSFPPSCQDNYKRRMHNLLYLEEYQQRVDMNRLACVVMRVDMSRRACVVTRRENSVLFSVAAQVLKNLDIQICDVITNM